MCHALLYSRALTAKLPHSHRLPARTSGDSTEGASVRLPAALLDAVWDLFKSQGVNTLIVVLVMLIVVLIRTVIGIARRVHV